MGKKKESDFEKTPIVLRRIGREAHLTYPESGTAYS